MSDVKYYICIKEIEEDINNNEGINDFIQYAFDDNKMRGRYWDRYNNAIFNDVYYSHRVSIMPRYNFKKNQIYQTTLNGDYIIDGANVTHKMVGLESYFIPFEFEIEPQAKKIIEAKKLKGDTIDITPLFYSPISKEIIYNIICTLGKDKYLYSNGTYQTIDISQVDGIMYCYRQLRILSRNKKKLEEMLVGIYYKKRFKKH